MSVFLRSNYKLKPKDLTMLQNNLKTVEEIELSANKVRNVISNADALLFSKTTSKLKTGNECAHQFMRSVLGHFARMKKWPEKSSKRY